MSEEASDGALFPHPVTLYSRATFQRLAFGPRPAWPPCVFPPAPITMMSGDDPTLRVSLIREVPFTAEPRDNIFPTAALCCQLKDLSGAGVRARSNSRFKSMWLRPFFFFYLRDAGRLQSKWQQRDVQGFSPRNLCNSTHISDCRVKVQVRMTPPTSLSV